MPQLLNVVLFGATGMVGSEVLAQCLEEPAVETVLAVVRRPTGIIHPKLAELVISDFYDYSAVSQRLSGYNACFFTLGVSSVGRDEEQYTHETYDLTLAAAKALLAVNQRMSFCYVSGQGTDSTESGSSMWARVKGRTENALMELPFKHVAMIRLGALKPAPGYRSKTLWIRVAYAVLGPFLPLFKLVGVPVLDGPTLGRAMILAAQGHAKKKILDPGDLMTLGSDGNHRRLSLSQAHLI